MKTCDILTQTRSQAKDHVYNFTLWPKLWEIFNQKLSYSWLRQPFSKSAKGKIPEKSGVYTFVIEPCIANHTSCAFLIYAGKTNNLRKRFTHYIAVKEGSKGHSPKLEHGLRQHSKEGYLFFYYSFQRKTTLKKYEQALIDGFVPPWNDKKTISSNVGKIVRAFL